MASQNFTESSLPGSTKSAANGVSVNAGSNMDGNAEGDNTEAQSAVGSPPATLHGGDIEVPPVHDRKFLLDPDGSGGEHPNRVT
jgi:hypothetical protein